VTYASGPNEQRTVRLFRKTRAAILSEMDQRHDRRKKVSLVSNVLVVPGDW